MGLLSCQGILNGTLYQSPKCVIGRSQIALKTKSLWEASENARPEVAEWKGEFGAGLSRKLKSAI
jgi:hypothetical protein